MELYNFSSSENSLGFYFITEDERKLFEKGESLINKEEQNRDTETGKTIWLSTTKIPFRDSSGNIIGLVGINRNITENKRAKRVFKK